MMIGRTISHYQIVEKLGEGGMGEVYRAEDTKLGRTVALKFLAAPLLNDAEAKQRFLREAQSAAALHHPNICTVFEVDEADGKTFLAMACLEGESLEDRIAKGPLPLKDALEIGRQIADGLEAAHEKGIVHRDIKPANVMVDAKGHATILDFGLARLAEASKLTRADQTVGTVAYMSPEQIQGGEVDHRTDIWALGCTLYEMVAGVRPFQGQYDQALAYEICNEEPEPLTAVRAGVPMELEFIVGNCLAIDPDDRLSSAQEAARELRTLAEKLKSGRSKVWSTSRPAASHRGSAATSRRADAPAALPPGHVAVKEVHKRALQALAAAASLAALAFAYAYFSAPEPREPERPVRRFSLSIDGVGHAEISPDGKHIALSRRDEQGDYRLWLRPLDSETLREIPGTQGSRFIFGGWTPDSRSIYFATQTELKRASIDGGDPVVLCTLPGRGLFGFTFADLSPGGDLIVFGSGNVLYEIPARGGEPTALLEPESGETLAVPRFLPVKDRAGALLYQVNGGGEPRVEALDLGSGERKPIGPGTMASYDPSGYLIHQLDGYMEPGLFATPFSLEKLEKTGDTFPLDVRGLAASASRNGLLLYRAGAGDTWRMDIVDRTGSVLSTVDVVQGGVSAPEVSPDGRRAAVHSEGDVWLYDLERGVRSRLTTGDDQESAPVWLSSGQELTYLATRRGELMVRSADGGGEARALFPKGTAAPRVSWGPGDRFVAYSDPDPAGGEAGIWYRERSADGSFSEPVSYLRTRFNENQAQISPDGRYLAYGSDETGRFEVYVRSFPEGAGKIRVSTDGGTDPNWSPDGSELFYRERRTLVAVSVSTEPAFTAGPAERLFSVDGTQTFYFDVLPDGRRFLLVSREDESSDQKIHLIENWSEEFRQREPE